MLISFLLYTALAFAAAADSRLQKSPTRYLLTMAAEIPDTQGSNWDEVQDCQRCGEQTKLSEGAVQKATGGLPQTLQSMTTSEQKTFWKKSSEILKVTPRNGRWSQVRSSLVTEMCRFKKEQTTRRVFGETWAAPMLTIDDEEIRGTVEKELAEKEYALKNKKKTGPKSKAAPVEQTEKIEIDDDVWSIPSETEVVLPKANKASKTKAEDDAGKAAAAAARKAAREMASAWKKEVAKAAKCCASLNSVHQSLVTNSVKCEKNKDLFNEQLLKGVNDALQEITKVKTSAAALVSATDEEKTSKMPAIFPDVTDVQEKVKAAQQVLKDVRAVFAERAALNRSQKEAAKPKETSADAKAKSAPRRRATSKQAGQ
eukprot:s2002_g11.t1